MGYELECSLLHSPLVPDRRLAPLHAEVLSRQPKQRVEGAIAAGAVLVLPDTPDTHPEHAVEEFLTPGGTLVVARAVRAAAGTLERIVELPALLLPVVLQVSDKCLKDVFSCLHTDLVSVPGEEGCGG